MTPNPPEPVSPLFPGTLESAIVAYQRFLKYSGTFANSQKFYDNVKLIILVEISQLGIPTCHHKRIILNCQQWVEEYLDGFHTLAPTIDEISKLIAKECQATNN